MAAARIEQGAEVARRVELLPQLRVGKVTRGRIGVGIGAVPADAVDELGLKDRNGAVVLNVAPTSAADKAGIEPGDVIISYNGKPIRNRDVKVAPNAPCPCGSGKKYKKCCGAGV